VGRRWPSSFRRYDCPIHPLRLRHAWPCARIHIACLTPCGARDDGSLRDDSHRTYHHGHPSRPATGGGCALARRRVALSRPECNHHPRLNFHGYHRSPSPGLDPKAAELARVGYWHRAGYRGLPARMERRKEVQQQRVGERNLEAGLCWCSPAMARADNGSPCLVLRTLGHGRAGGRRPVHQGRLAAGRGKALEISRCPGLAVAGEGLPLWNPERRQTGQLVQEGLAAVAAPIGRWPASCWCSDEINVAPENWATWSLKSGAWRPGPCALSSLHCGLDRSWAPPAPAGCVPTGPRKMRLVAPPIPRERDQSRRSYRVLSRSRCYCRRLNEPSAEPDGLSASPPHSAANALKLGDQGYGIDPASCSRNCQAMLAELLPLAPPVGHRVVVFH